jgi:hypothetical protein
MAVSASVALTVSETWTPVVHHRHQPTRPPRNASRSGPDLRQPDRPGGFYPLGAVENPVEAPKQPTPLREETLGTCRNAKGSS